MDRITLDTRVREAMRSGNVVDSRESADILDEALRGGISPLELVIVRNSLERAKQHLAGTERGLYRAERNLDAANGPLDIARAIADREVARSRRDRAENFVRGYERIEGLFRQNAGPIAIALAAAGNVAGDVGRGLEEIFD
ncbi:MAG: hypothetical protein ACAI38_04060 [Myxococcota bacterium]